MASAPLLSITYVSAAASTFGPDELAELLEYSRTANRAVEVSGMLLYRGGRFLQVLEGPERAVRTLVDKIRHDPRHRDMRVLLTEHVDERRFADWTMGYEPIGVPAGPAPTGFRDTFDDLETGDDTTTARALRELTVWFRARSRPGD